MQSQNSNSARRLECINLKNPFGFGKKIRRLECITLKNPFALVVLQHYFINMESSLLARLWISILFIDVFLIFVFIGDTQPNHDF